MILRNSIDDSASECCVLIVEDNKINQAVLEATVHRCDPYANIVIAANGKQALDLLDTLPQDPDVILLDLSMPVMDGFEFLDLYVKRQKSSDPVLVIVTASDEREDMQRAQSFGCVNKYIVKPLQKADMDYIMHSVRS